MELAAAVEASQIAVELRADVPEFMSDRIEFLPKRQIEIAGQVEAENVHHLAAERVVKPLNAPWASASNDLRPTAGKAHGRHRGIDALLSCLARLAKADCHARHVDVTQIAHASDHILTEAPHVRGEIETRLGPVGPEARLPSPAHPQFPSWNRRRGAYSGAAPLSGGAAGVGCGSTGASGVAASDSKVGLGARLCTRSC